MNSDTSKSRKQLLHEILANFGDNKDVDDDNLKDTSNPHSYSELSDKILKKYILPSFYKEDDFISNMRMPLAIFIMLLIMAQIIFLFLIAIGFTFLSSLIDNFKFDTGVFSILATAVFANTVGLMTVLFKYIFNRKENKILDVIDSFLKTRSDYEIQKDVLNNDKDKDNK